jgi:hypothetical protein
VPIPPPESADVLNGWKEIAAHLGRSARSVQRWERDLGLPVHRIPTPEGGSIVYARRSEVDSWRARQSDLSNQATEGVGAECSEGAAQVPGGADWSVSSIPSPTPQDVAARLARWLNAPVPAWSALALAGVAVAVALGLASALQPRSLPATWSFEGRELIAYSDSGRALWRHSFGRMVSRPSTLSRGIGALGDVNDDGRPDVLTAVRFAASSGTPSESDAVFAFGADGALLWSVQPELVLAADAETFEGPWHVHDIVTGVSDDGPRTWIAFSHHTWWPGFVIEVAPNGTFDLRYVQPGRIYSLTYWKVGTRTLLMAGGTLNEAGRASMALVDLDQPPARWRAEGGLVLECASCPRDDPAAMLLLPTPDVTRALFRPYGWVTGGRLLDSGVEVSTNDGFGGGSLFQVSEDFQVTSAARSDRYWQVHRDLEAQGRITHAIEHCPDWQQPLEVRRWTADSGWSTLRVPLRAASAAVHD